MKIHKLVIGWKADDTHNPKQNTKLEWEQKAAQKNCLYICLKSV